MVSRTISTLEVVMELAELLSSLLLVPPLKKMLRKRLKPKLK